MPCKGHTIKRPFQLVCSLEIQHREDRNEGEKEDTGDVAIADRRLKIAAMNVANERIRLPAEDSDTETNMLDEQ